VDPLGQCVFCPYCGASSPVPGYLKASAGAYHRELEQARVLRSDGAVRVRQEQATARAHQWRTISYLAIGATFVVPGILGVIGFVGFYVVLQGNIVPASLLTVHRLHRLVACAYGLSSAAD